MGTSKKLGARDLKVGGRYLHRNGLFVRQIDALQGDTVFWHDKIGSGQCSKNVFLKQCHSIAPEFAEDLTPTEVASDPPNADEFSIRDEANALTHSRFGTASWKISMLERRCPSPNARVTAAFRTMKCAD